MRDLGHGDLAQLTRAKYEVWKGGEGGKGQNPRIPP